jgi:hypothetical protein
MPSWTGSSSSASSWGSGLTCRDYQQGDVREGSPADDIAVVVPLADPASPAPLLNATDDPPGIQSRVGSGFYSKDIELYELELGRPGIWLRIDLEKPPSTQMSCPVT